MSEWQPVVLGRRKHTDDPLREMPERAAFGSQLHDVERFWPLSKVREHLGGTAAFEAVLSVLNAWPPKDLAPETARVTERVLETLAASFPDRQEPEEER